jgi:hypothetical protein
MVYWEKTFGGSEWDEANAVIEIANGGFVIAGFTNSFGEGSSDIFLIKTNSNGDSVWTKTYGGIGWDVAESVDETQDGGYIIAGYTYSFGNGESDVYLVRTDSDGNILWERTYGGITEDCGNSVQQTTDGGFIVTGISELSIYLIKTDQNGDTVWTKKYAKTAGGVGCSVQQTSDGGYIITGHTEYHGNICLLKVDTNGDSLWGQMFGTDNDINFGRSVKETFDGGYIIVGSTHPLNAGSFDIYLIKTNEIGNVEWTKKFGAEASDYGRAIDLLADEGYIIAGWTNSFGNGAGDVYLIETDENGNEKWSRTHGYENGEGAYSILVASDGCYVVAGCTNSLGAGWYDAYLVKIRSFSWYP